MFYTSLVLSPEAFRSVYHESALSRIRKRAALASLIPGGTAWRNHREQLARTEFIFSGWGAPVMDEEFLETARNLKMIFYAGGSVRYFVTEAFWQRGIRVTAAHAINAIPVSEYAVSAIILGLKRFWHLARVTRERRMFPAERPVPGAYRTTVGLVSYGNIARLVRRKLLGYDVDVVVFDPFLSDAEAATENVRKAGLDEIFATADAVSLHAPLLEETRGMITGAHFAAMKTDATFINTARGAIVNESEMIACLQRRPDLQAILDVTSPEPPTPDSPLYTLPNVSLTPHIAGSLDTECWRMGDAMADEFERYLDGRPLHWEITPEKIATMA